MPLLVDDLRAAAAAGSASSGAARRARGGRHDADRDHAVDARRPPERLGAAGRRRRRVDGDEQRCGAAALRRVEALVEGLAGHRAPGPAAAAAARRLLAAAALETQMPLQPAAPRRRLGTLASAAATTRRQVRLARPLVLRRRHTKRCGTIRNLISVCLCAHLTLYPATDCTAATDISGVSSRWQLSR